MHVTRIPKHTELSYDKWKPGYKDELKSDMNLCAVDLKKTTEKMGNVHHAWLLQILSRDG